MKLTYALLAAAAACGLASAAETAYTTPVGYVSLGDTTIGQPAIKGNTDVVVSLPLDRPASYAGTISSVSGSTITLSGSPGLGSLIGSPNLLKIESGAVSGLVGLITANTANSVTIQVPSGDSISSLVAGDRVSIRPAWTLLTALGSSLPAGTQVLAFSGTSAGLNVASDLLYEWDGTNRLDGFTFDTADNVAIYTGESFIVRNPTVTTVPSLVISGEVSTSNSRVVVSNLAPGTGQDNRLAFVSPVDETIGNSGLGAIATAGDQVLEFDNNASGINKAASFIAEWDGSAWLDGFTFDDISATFKLKAGKGYVIRRTASAPGGDVVWSNQPDYVPSL